MSMGSDHALVMSVTDGNSLRLLTFVIMFYALLVLAILFGN